MKRINFIGFPIKFASFSFAVAMSSRHMKRLLSDDLGEMEEEEEEELAPVSFQPRNSFAVCLFSTWLKSYWY